MELTSSVGALVLGIGLGALLGNVLGGFGLPLLIAGALVHGWGMFDKHRLEQRAGAPDVRWHIIAYWACWLLLALMALIAVGTLITERPPHRSERAQFGHSAPTLGV